MIAVLPLPREKYVGATLASLQSPNRHFGRLGGEEFAVLLAGAGLDEGLGFAERCRSAIAATRALPPRDGLPILLLHGLDDGLVPEWTTSAPYAAFAREHGARLGYWRIERAQHFDAFLGNPALAARYVPLMPQAYAALDAMLAHLREGAPLPGDRGGTSSGPDQSASSSARSPASGS